MGQSNMRKRIRNLKIAGALAERGIVTSSDHNAAFHLNHTQWPSEFGDYEIDSSSWGNRACESWSTVLQQFRFWNYSVCTPVACLTLNLRKTIDVTTNIRIAAYDAVSLYKLVFDSIQTPSMFLTSPK